ncbi:hypothetical protein GCM10017567_19680 [Amycolatopsis bullii]|uniref:Uncharacterized protein n=1 Tax=Amycolatopsis bullii TaxID=941987 RepID=A0ABQ3K8N9_9PSEU|nr:hypothetical protein GCM10017567_19680 [Amycolatopsis bullii]
MVPAIPADVPARPSKTTEPGREITAIDGRPPLVGVPARVVHEHVDDGGDVAERHTDRLRNGRHRKPRNARRVSRRLPQLTELWRAAHFPPSTA